MPELPEVHTVARDLHALISGRRIKDVWCGAPQLLRSGTLLSLRRFLSGAEVRHVYRKGKHIIFSLDKDRAFAVHLKMTGHFLTGSWILPRKFGVLPQLRPGFESEVKEPVNRFIRLVISFKDGTEIGLSDARKFARVRWGNEQDLLNLPEFAGLGPDALAEDFTAQEFAARLTGTRRTIKQALLDQTIVAGFGNIYADDALYAAGIHPMHRADQVSEARLKKLFVRGREVLRKAIALRGSSMIAFRHMDGAKGAYGPERLVYGRTGEPCRRCKEPIVRKKIQGRSTHFCMKCQN